MSDGSEDQRASGDRKELPLEEHATPMNIEISGSEENADGKLMDLSFDCRKGVRIGAYLIEPHAPAPWPAVLMVHPAPGDRSYFLAEGWKLAREGIGSLLLDAPWSDPAWGTSLTAPEDAIRAVTVSFRKVQRCIELLSTLDDVDHDKMGYLGMSLGALIGGIVVSIDHRLKAAVLMSGVGSFTDVASLNVPELSGEALDRYRGIMAAIDPQAYIGKAAPTQLLFQYGNQDVFPREKLIAFAEGGSEPKKVIEYEAGHYLNEQARDDAVAWLVEALGR